MEPVVPAMKSITWVDPNVIPDAAHLLHHSKIWCVANDKGHVAVYDHGTGRNQANSVQGNRNRDIAERFVERYAADGSVGLVLVEHLFLVDNPGRY